MRPDEAAAYLRLCRRTIYKLMGERELPSYKVGNATLLRQSDLDEYVMGKRRAI
jgi:excisionase family DNA binding protein